MAGNDSETQPAPGEDFYKFVNHKWLTNGEEPPAEYPIWGGFTKLVDESLKSQIELLQGLSEASSGLNEDEEKLALIWKASMKRFAEWAESGGSNESLVTFLKWIEEGLVLDDDESYMAALPAFFAEFQQEGVHYPFSLMSEANPEDSDAMCCWLAPGGLSMPTRGHYLDETFSQQRTWFREHLEQVLDHLGADVLGEDFVERIVRFETKLAQISMSPEQERQFDQFYTVTSLDEISENVNELASFSGKEKNYEENIADDADKDLLTESTWTLDDSQREMFGDLINGLFEETGIRQALENNCEKHYNGEAERKQRIVACDGDFLRRVFTLIFRAENREDVRAYLMYKAIKAKCEFNTKELDELFFDLYGKKLGGQKEQKSNEKRSVGIANEWAGELLGKIYVKENFSEDDKENILDMIADSLKAIKKSIRNNTWMTPPTKEAALLKMDALRPMIGYPDKWRNFSSFKPEESDSISDISRKSYMFKHQDLLEYVNAPRDPTRWEMTPQMVNAYFDPSANVICFPAAILQAPFYYKSVDEIDTDLGEIPLDTPGLLDALNFGGIVPVINHEIGHSVDDQGCKFDHNGNLKDWWTESDREAFNAQAKLMANQTSQYTVEEVNEKGEKTVHRQKPDLVMGEALADACGLSVACKAMLARLHPGVLEPEPVKPVAPKKSLFGLFKNRRAKEAAAATAAKQASVAERHSRAEQEDAKLRLMHLEALFRSWATVWRSKQSTAYEVKLLSMDPHPATAYRGGRVPPNVDEFYEVFPEVKEGDPMFIPKEERVQMW